MLGDEIQWWMEKRGLEVKDVADAAGIAVQSVYQWLKGDTKSPKPENVVAVAALFGVTAEILVLGKREEGDRIARISQKLPYLPAPKVDAIYELIKDWVVGPKYTGHERRQNAATVGYLGPEKRAARADDSGG